MPRWRSPAAKSERDRGADARTDDLSIHRHDFPANPIGSSKISSEGCRSAIAKFRKRRQAGVSRRRAVARRRPTRPAGLLRMQTWCSWANQSDKQRCLQTGFAGWQCLTGRRSTSSPISPDDK
jgi:hypothetical protein